MSKNKTQIKRLIFVDQMIRDGMKSGVLANCREIAGLYEVSYKSIMRDIDYLKNQCDAPIMYDPQRHGFYYTEEQYQLPAINISESDLFAICIARKALEQHQNTPIYQKLVSVFNKIEQSLPDRISIAPVWVDNRISVLNDSKTRIDPQIWEGVAQALQRNQRLRITYCKPGEIWGAERDVEPFHVVSFQGEWYLIAFCRLRQEIRVFAISRIGQVEKSATFFKIPDDFDYREFVDSHFGIFRDESRCDVVVRFSARHAPYLLEREWHPGQVVEKQEDGSLIISFSTSHLVGVKRWVLSWGGGTEVLKPDKLRSDLRLEVQKILQAYD